MDEFNPEKTCIIINNDNNNNNNINNNNINNNVIKSNSSKSKNINSNSSKSNDSNNINNILSSSVLLMKKAYDNANLVPLFCCIINIIPLRTILILNKKKNYLFLKK